MGPIVIYVDGAGCRPDGRGSGFAWIQPSSGEQHIEQIDGLTNNQAEYRALISALVALRAGKHGESSPRGPSGLRRFLRPDSRQPFVSERHSMIV